MSSVQTWQKPMFTCDANTARKKVKGSATENQPHVSKEKWLISKFLWKIDGLSGWKCSDGDRSFW